MAKSIPVFCLNLNNQFIYDKCSDNGHPREPFIQINGRLPYYKLFRGMFFLSLRWQQQKFLKIFGFCFLKMGISVLSGGGIYLENRNVIELILVTATLPGT